MADDDPEVSLESATFLLEQAEERAAQQYAPDHVWEKAQRAFVMAKPALVAFRRAGDMKNRKRALAVVVKAELLMGDTFDALQFAQDELAMTKRTCPDDRASQATMTELVVQCLQAREDTVGALAILERLLALQRELESRSGEAKALQLRASVQVQTGQHALAIEAGEASLKIYKELEEPDEQEATSRIVSQAYCSKGQPGRAPNREAALQALEALGKALDDLDHRAWPTQLELLHRSGAFQTAEFEDMVCKSVNAALEDDYRRATLEFLEFHGIDTTPYGGRLKSTATMVGQKQQYLNMRVSHGQGYGPQFRNIEQTSLVGVNAEAPSYSACVLKDPQFEEEDWGKSFMTWHPGLLQGVLQGAETMRLF